VNDISDITGNIGKVSLGQADDGKSLRIDGYMDVPPGGELRQVKDQISSNDAYSALFGVLEMRNLVPPGSSQADYSVTSTVDAIPEMQCLMVNTMFAPNLMAAEPYTTNSSMCQEQCAKTAECYYFTFFKATSVCTLQGKAAVASTSKGASAGPRKCAQIPGRSEPSTAELYNSGTGGFSMVWIWVLLVALLLGALAVWIARSKQAARWMSGRQVSRSSSSGTKLEKGPVHKYLPLSGEQDAEDLIHPVNGKGFSQRSASLPAHGPVKQHGIVNGGLASGQALLDAHQHQQQHELPTMSSDIYASPATGSVLPTPPRTHGSEQQKQPLTWMPQFIGPNEMRISDSHPSFGASFASAGESLQSDSNSFQALHLQQQQMQQQMQIMQQQMQIQMQSWQHAQLQQTGLEAQQQLQSQQMQFGSPLGSPLATFDQPGSPMMQPWQQHGSPMLQYGQPMPPMPDSLLMGQPNPGSPIMSMHVT